MSPEESIDRQFSLRINAAIALLVALSFALAYLGFRLTGEKKPKDVDANVTVTREQLLGQIESLKMELRDVQEIVVDIQLTLRKLEARIK